MFLHLFYAQVFKSLKVKVETSKSKIHQCAFQLIKQHSTCKKNVVVYMLHSGIGETLD